MANKKAAAAIERAGKPTDPVFQMLVRHTESVRTEHGLIALRRLGKELGADLLQIALHEDGSLYICISAKNRHYSVWHHPDGRADVESYDDILDEFGEKSWADIDRYDTQNGVTMANGITRAGGE